MFVRVDQVARTRNNQTLQDVNREVERLNDRRMKLKEELQVIHAQLGKADI